MQSLNTTPDERIRFLEKYGYPGPLAQATALNRCFPQVLVNEYGYWAYVVQKCPIPFAPKIVYFVGDPICSQQKLHDFVRAAVNELRAVGRVAALQVHKPTALAFEGLAQNRYIAHQLGVESQVRLPVVLTGQLGTKVRQAAREGLTVEELVWRQEDTDTSSRGIQMHMGSGIVQKTKTRMTTDEYRNDLQYRDTFHDSDESTQKCDRLIARIEEMLEAAHNPELEKFKRKIERLKAGGIPPGINFFVDIQRHGSENEFSGFGYYQPSPYGYNRHRFEIISAPRLATYQTLKSGKLRITTEELDVIEHINTDWLSRQLNPKEMGVPLLKPFNREYEPARRFFVARNVNNDIIAFVDFDPVNWINVEGTLEMNQRGYYANLIRNTEHRDDNNNKLYKNVSYLLLGMAAQRFTDEGCCVLNLGLNPLGLIKRERIASAKGRLRRYGLSLIEILLYSISANPITNATTYAYEGVMRTKQQNWQNREDITTYVVFDGMLLPQLYDMVNGFLITGAIGSHVVINSLRYLSKQMRQKSGLSM